MSAKEVVEEMVQDRPKPLRYPVKCLGEPVEREGRRAGAEWKTKVEIANNVEIKPEQKSVIRADYDMTKSAFQVHFPDIGTRPQFSESLEKGVESRICQGDSIGGDVVVNRMVIWIREVVDGSTSAPRFQNRANSGIEDSASKLLREIIDSAKLTQYLNPATGIPVWILFLSVISGKIQADRFKIRTQKGQKWMFYPVFKFCQGHSCLDLSSEHHYWFVPIPACDMATQNKNPKRQIQKFGLNMAIMGGVLASI